MRPVRALHARRRRVAERPLRGPGRRVARPRQRHARRAARPPRAARRRRRALQPALGPDRARAGRVRLGGQRRCSGPPRPRHPRRRRDRRLARVGERRQGEGLRARRVLVRGLRPRRRLALPLGAAVADVERAEPGALAAPGDRRASTSARSSTPATPRSTRSIPGAKVAGGVRRRAARAAASRPSSGSAACARPRPARRVRPPPVSVEQPRDAVHAAAASTARRSRWPRSSG